MPKNTFSFRLNTRRARRLARRLLAEGNAQVRTGIDESTKRLENLIKNDILNRQGGGRVYPSARGTTSAAHQASAPGEPPAPDTNTYRQSWTHDLLEGGAKGVVFTADDRGPMLEYGTVRMEPRPHVKPAAKKHRKVHSRTILKAIREAARRARSA